MRIEDPGGRIWMTFCLASLACTSNKIVPTADSRGLPPDAAGALSRLGSSPRHGEWVTIRTGDGDSLRAWVVYPERSTKAPVVLVVHEVFEWSSWGRRVADQLPPVGFTTS